MISNIIIEGIDRLGKDTLIKGLQDRYGYFQVLHYVKPLLLDTYVKEITDENYISEETKRKALKFYQKKSFRMMFNLLRGYNFGIKIICNRAHLGEMVYAKRYRGYDGDYVFDIESQFNYYDGPLENTLLVLLHTSSFAFVSDDGLSMDVTKREEEQVDFINAFKRSIMPHKIMIDVHDGNGNFVPASTVLNKVCSKL